MPRAKAKKERASSDRDRFYVQADKHGAFQQLSRGEEAPFSTIKDVFVVSAALGYRAGVRRPFKGGRQHVGFWRSFTVQEDVPLLQAIAVADTGDVNVLADQGEVIRISEEYANEGIELLLDMQRADRGGTLRAMAAAVSEA
jgi:dnd system-associated protein 4